MQRRITPDPATYLGKGKAEELLSVCLAVDADTVVFDDDLSPAQQRNLERILGRTAIDRTAVILDIFAQNARTPEGRAQVELALLRYRLPRLRGRGRSFSQQAGGIGTRGPGETKLEVDRRRLVRRMTRLESDLRQLDRTRRTQQRGQGPLPAADGLPRRVHQRGQVHPAQSAVPGRCAGGEPALLHARSPHPPPRPPRRRDGAAHRHRRVRAQAPAPGGRGLPLDAGGGVRLRSHRPCGGRLGPRLRGPGRRRPDGAGRDRRRRPARAPGRQQGRRRGRPAGRGRRGGPSPAGCPPGLGHGLGPHGRGDRPAARGHGRPPPGRRPRGRVGHPLGPGRRPGRRPPRGGDRGRGGRRALDRGSRWSSTPWASPASPSSWPRDAGLRVDGRAGRLLPTALSLRPAGDAQSQGRGPLPGSTAGWWTARSAPRSTRPRPSCSRPWPTRTPSAAIRPPSGLRPTGGPRRDGWPAVSAYHRP